MRQHDPSKLCDGLSVVHTCVRPIADGGATVQISCARNLMKVNIQTHVCVSIWWLEFTAVPLGQKFITITIFSSKDCNHDPFSCWHPLHFFFWDNVWYHSIHCCMGLGSKWWSQVSSHDNLQKEALNLSVVLEQEISGLPFPFEWIRQHSRQPTSTDLRGAKLFNNLHYTAFTNGQNGA